MTRSKPQSCIGCACYDHGSDFSQVEGTGSLNVLVCGEASGDNEARDQLPFRPYAQAGSVLQRIFRMAGYDRNQFSITNTLRCRPRGDWLAKSPWEYAAISHCSPNLDAVVAERKPKAIWALGDIAMRTLTGMTGKHRNIMLLQGYVLDSRYGIPLIASLHPSFIARGLPITSRIHPWMMPAAFSTAARTTPTPLSHTTLKLLPRVT
jgi:uracil-DNA glycosylase family 4